MAPIDGGEAKVDAAAAFLVPADGTVVYTWEDADVDAPGYYHGEFEVTFDDDSTLTFPNDGYLLIHVTAQVADDSLQPGPRDLCTLTDVIGLVPAYTPTPTTDAKLRQLTTAESAQFMEDCGREITSDVSDPAARTRTFEIDRRAAWVRSLDIGDLSTIDDVVVTLKNQDGTTAEVVEASAVVPLYGAQRDPSSSWEPITGLTFPAYLPDSPALRSGQTIEVEGVWGFPSIPPHAREGCAAGVVLRALNDVANTGTDFAEAANTVGFQGLVNRRQDAIEALKRFAAA
jgi:hypothetical protein